MCPNLIVGLHNDGNRELLIVVQTNKMELCWIVDRRTLACLMIRDLNAFSFDVGNRALESGP